MKLKINIILTLIDIDLIENSIIFWNFVFCEDYHTLIRQGRIQDFFKFRIAPAWSLFLKLLLM